MVWDLFPQNIPNFGFHDLPYMPLINSVIKWLNLKRIYQIEHYGKFPFEIQKEVLFQLLSSAQNTDYGKLYGFEHIGTIEEFQSSLPLQTYEDI